MAKDILLGNDGDILIEAGDIVFGASENDDVQLLFLSHKGEFKEFPLLGFGASSFLKRTDSSLEEFERELEIQLEFCGFKDPEIDLKDGIENLKINV